MATQSGLSTPNPKSARFTTSSSKPLQSNLVSKVRVVVRVRPFLASEIQENGGNPISCVSVLNPEFFSVDEVAVHLKDQETSRKECYKLDSFFGEDDTVYQIFDKEVSPLIPWIFHGSNATVFAYGATGSGKTHTMQGTDELPGLMSLAMSNVLSMCENAGSSAEISYYEVYMDRCYDLLEPKAREISVLDDKDGQVQLRGLSRVPVSSMSEFDQVLSSGIQRRKVAHTGLNDVSSRSHGVLVIVVTNPSGDGSKSVVTGKLNLIDLAGNEDNRRTCNEGIRLQESAKINQSLFALSNVIYALNNNKPRVPYRESKLTRILQDSLGGASRSLMVACLNPGEYQESVYTVSLAARSRQVSNYVPSTQNPETPKVKIDMEAKLRAWLESKGKTKSAQRIGGFGSPLSKTPIPMSSLKKQNLYQKSGKAKTAITDLGLSEAKERRLFDSEAKVFSSMDDDGLRMSESESHEEPVVTLPILEDHLNSYNRTGINGAEEDKKDTNPCNGCTNVLESVAYLPGESLEEKVTITSSINSVESPTNTERVKTLENPVGSPPNSARVKTLQNSIRKALSPINSNLSMKPLEDLPSKDQSCSLLFEPKTPKPPVLAYNSDGIQATSTPLNKFYAQSSNLKNTLVEEYLAFLNSASKEELLGLKGIGKKRAEYIVELRETSPLKSLSDLENIGLSSKQVNDIFRRTARGIFD
ncbi:Kinesin [Macleaya cordata]|uniref:Kinesin-like protein n=1 Tax=Macleaya cordata TaxID=56857 RepID=A0A200Q602_MACCD|nr:Kinesin [Macleaya cordata]